MSKQFVFFIIFIAFSGCISIQTVSIDVLKPAKVSVPTNIRKMLIINSAYTDSASSFTFPIQQTLFKFDTLVSQGILFKMPTVLSESPRFDTLTYEPNIVYRNQSQILKPLPASKIVELTRNRNTDAVLSLEAISLIDTILYTSIKMETGTFKYSYFAVQASTFWRIYDASNGNEVFQMVIDDTLFPQEFESTNLYYGYIENTNNRIALANDAANSIVYQVSDYIAPFWHTESRSMLVVESDSIVEGARLALKSDWIAAAAYWKPLAGSKSPKIAAAACHNMALVCEVAGKYDLAVTWIQDAIFEKNYPVSNTYYDILLNRIAESKQLDRQFGITKH